LRYQVAFDGKYMKMLAIVYEVQRCNQTEVKRHQLQQLLRKKQWRRWGFEVAAMIAIEAAFSSFVTCLSPPGLPHTC
jgi:hypothetical protein